MIAHVSELSKIKCAVKASGLRDPPSSETEFVAASQAGQEVLYLRALLKGFAYLQHGPTEIWEDNASCILMSEGDTQSGLVVA